MDLAGVILIGISIGGVIIIIMVVAYLYFAYRINEMSRRWDARDKLERDNFGKIMQGIENDFQNHLHNMEDRIIREIRELKEKK